MNSGDLLVERPEGLYCPPGDFYIDPWRPVARAVITHAHSDHARVGHGHYLAAAPGEGVLRARLGAISLQTLTYGKRIDHFGVRLSLHPAGHVLGSAQVRLEHAGRVWVASGDYFVSGAGDDNTTCAPFEPQRCDCFITESTFGLPIYRWQPQRALGEHTGLDPKLVAQRMMGYTDAKRAPDVARYTALLAPPEHGAAREAGEPYPFFLAHPIEGKRDSFEARFGAPGEWLVE